MVDGVALETHGRNPPGGCPLCPETAFHYVVKPATSRSAKCVGGPDQGGPTRSGSETTWVGHRYTHHHAEAGPRRLTTTRVRGRDRCPPSRRARRAPAYPR